MIGEDFRSQAFNNLGYAQNLEQQIEGLKDEVKKANQRVDDKDMELTLKDRESESFQMWGEEVLTNYDAMRADRDRLQRLLDESTALAN